MRRDSRKHETYTSQKESSNCLIDIFSFTLFFSFHFFIQRPAIPHRGQWNRCDTCSELNWKIQVPSPSHLGGFSLKQSHILLTNERIDDRHRVRRLTILTDEFHTGQATHEESESGYGEKKEFTSGNIKMREIWLHRTRTIHFRRVKKAFRHRRLLHL